MSKKLKLPNMPAVSPKVAGAVGAAAGVGGGLALFARSSPEQMLDDCVEACTKGEATSAACGSNCNTADCCKTTCQRGLRAGNCEVTPLGKATKENAGVLGSTASDALMPMLMALLPYVLGMIILYFLYLALFTSPKK
jgi:hypothetical protein